MKELGHFTKRILLFSLPLLALVGFLETSLRRVPNSYNTKRRFLESRLPNIEVLALGSSVGAMGLKPDELSAPAFNLSNISQSLIVDGQLFGKYLPRLPNLKVLVLNLFYPSLESRMAGGEEAWRNFFYQRFFEVPGDGTRQEQLDVRALSLFHLYGPSASAKYFRNGFKAEFDRIEESGWQPSQGNLWEAPEASARRWIEAHHKGMHPEYVEENARAIESMIEAAVARNVKVALLYLPTIAEYSRRADPEKLARHRAVLEGLERKYPGHVVRKDYFNDSRFTHEDFSDADHLNVRGASKFSRLVDEDAIRPLLSRPARDTASR